jgi:hypothetical protein
VVGRSGGGEGDDVLGSSLVAEDGAKVVAVDFSELDNQASDIRADVPLVKHRRKEYDLSAIAETGAKS